MGLTGWLYLADVLRNVDTILSIIIFVVIVLFFVSIFMLGTLNDNELDIKFEKRIFCFYKKWWIFALVLIIDMAIPSQKTMYLMLGSSFLSQSNLPSKVSQVLELKLDDIIKDLTKEKSKE